MVSLLSKLKVVLPLCDRIIEICIVQILLVLGDLLSIKLVLMLLGHYEIGLVRLAHISSTTVLKSFFQDHPDRLADIEICLAPRAM